MSFYNTGNPVPSIDPRDLDDNAKHIDEIVNSTDLTFFDRLGTERLTMAGVEVTLGGKNTGSWFEFNSAALLPSSDNSKNIGSASRRAAATYSREFRPGAGAVIWTSGTGSPEGAVTAPVGSVWSRTDGSVGTSTYVKESGAGNTGWVAVGSAVVTTTANGTAVKYPDGTMKCYGVVSIGSIAITTTTGAVFASSQQTGITFPAAFIAAPTYVSDCISVNATAWFGRAAIATTTAGPAYFVFAPITGSQAITLSYTAIGRWF